MKQPVSTDSIAERKTGADSWPSRADDGGWALLGLILAMAIMGIYLAALVPNVRFQVRRDKEAELLYRGEQMAKAIARYYNNGRLGGINPMQCPQPRGCLLELDKLKEPYIIGVNEHKLVRISATIDPMNSSEWEPVRLRDPRLMTVLQAYASETGMGIPPNYELLAGPPAPVILNPSNTPGTQPGGPQGNNPNNPNIPNNPNTPNNPNNPNNPNDPNAGGPGDPVTQTPPDPFAHFFDDSSPGLTNVPIIGVAPRIKGASVRTLYGLDHYEQWVFIYIPPQGFNQGGGSAPPPPPK